jgi:uncharacterized protein
MSASEGAATAARRIATLTEAITAVRRHVSDTDALAALARSRNSIAGSLERARRDHRALTVCWWRPGPDAVIRFLADPGYDPVGSIRAASQAEIDDQVFAHLARRQVRLVPLRRRPDRTGPDIEECFEHLRCVPVAMMISAAALDVDQAAAAMMSIEDEVYRSSVNRELSDVDVERVREAHAMLDSASERGLWQVEILVAARRADDAEAMLGMLSGGLDLADLPVVLASASDRHGDPDPVAELDRGARRDWPLLPADIVSAFLRPPMREIPGVRAVLYTSFDYCPETYPDRAPDRTVLSGVQLGTVLDAADSPAGAFEVPLSTLNRHCCVFGATGSGKTWGLAPMAGQLIRQGKPVAVLEETKDEWTSILLGQLAGTGQQLFKIMPGSVDNNDAPVSLNPLVPATLTRDGKTYMYPLATHAERLRYQLCAAFRAEPPLPQIFGKAISMAYEQKGLPMHLAGQLTSSQREMIFPSMSDLRLAAMTVVAKNGYRGDVLANVMGAVDIRLGSLLEGPGGEFLERGHPLTIAELATRNVVLCLDLVYDDAAKMLLSTAFLTANSEYWWLVNWLGKRDTATGSGELRRVIIGDEFHRVAPYAYPGAPWEASVKLLSDALAEDRNYGIGYIVADQSPTALIPGVIKNTALKIVKRLVDRDDRAVIGGSMNLSGAQEEALVGLDKSVAIVHSDGMDYPVRIEQLRPRLKVTEPGDKAEIQPPLATTACVACEGLCRRDVFGRSSTSGAGKAVLLFCEVAVVSHMRGLGLSAPAARWRHLALRGADASSAEFRCACGKLVSQAVRRRSTAIPDSYTTAQLEQHVFGQLMEIFHKAGRGCRPERKWRAGPYIWGEIRFRLREKSHPLYDSDEMPHPDTAAWARAGFALNSENWHAQREEVELHFADRRSLAGVAYGDVDPAGVPKPGARNTLPPLQEAIYELSGLTAGPFSAHARSCLNLLNADPRLLKLLTAPGRETA